MKTALCAIVCSGILLQSSIVCCGKKGVKENQMEIFARTSQIEKILKNPELYYDSLVQISGLLQNLGKDYFRDLRLVIKDTLGHSIPVLPWLPVEIPPLMDRSKPRPKIMSDFLGKKVSLQGYLEKGTAVDNAGVHFRVKTAEIQE